MAAPIVTEPGVSRPAIASGAVVRGALWVNDLRRLGRLDPSPSDYLLTEVCMRMAELATAMQVPALVVSQRLERGCRAFVAWSRNDVVVSWVWVSIGQEWAPPLRQDLVFARDESYGWDAGTLPQHRGRGLFSALLRLVGWRMAEDGGGWMWGGIEDSNLASQRAAAAAGYRPVLRLTAAHEPPPTLLRVRPADYADPELVRRALRVLGAEGPGRLQGEERS
jgi:hypothetical protein